MLFLSRTISYAAELQGFIALADLLIFCFVWILFSLKLENKIAFSDAILYSFSFLLCRQSLFQTWRISWTKVKENGQNVENYSCTYTIVPVEKLQWWIYGSIFLVRMELFKFHRWVPLTKWIVCIRCCKWMLCTNVNISCLFIPMKWGSTFLLDCSLNFIDKAIMRAGLLVHFFHPSGLFDI